MNKILLAVILCIASIGCGGQISRLPQDSPTPRPTPVPTPTPVTITASQVFGQQMVGQTWLFEGTCGGTVLDPYGVVLADYPVQPFHTTLAVQHGTAFTYTKDVDCGYWALGSKQAALYDFALELDANGGWYNTGGHIVMPFGCPWCNGITGIDIIYTVPPPADPTLPRPYLIIPPYGSNQYKITVSTEYGTVKWITISYVENVVTPVYSGPALVSEQIENGCVHEIWYLGIGVGLVKVVSKAMPGCSGLQSDVTMVRVQ